MLGAEQSGNVACVGFDLFCQMLDEAVHELRGEPMVARGRPGAQLRRRRAPARGLRGRRRRPPLALQAPRERASPRHVRTSPPRWRIASAPPPEEARRFVNLMRLKTELRRLRALGCEATAAGRDAAFARRYAARPEKIMALIKRTRGAVEAHTRHAPLAAIRTHSRRPHPRGVGARRTRSLSEERIVESIGAFRPLHRPRSKYRACGSPAWVEET